MPICAKPCKQISKVEIDYYDALILCGAVCDLLYLNERSYCHLRRDHERIKAAKEHLDAAIQRASEEVTDERKEQTDD